MLPKNGHLIELSFFEDVGCSLFYEPTQRLLAYATKMGAYAVLSSKRFAYAACVREVCAEFAFAASFQSSISNLQQTSSGKRQGQRDLF